MTHTPTSSEENVGENIADVQVPAEETPVVEGGTPTDAPVEHEDPHVPAAPEDPSASAEAVLTGDEDPSASEPVAEVAAEPEAEAAAEPEAEAAAEPVAEPVAQPVAGVFAPSEPVAEPSMKMPMSEEPPVAPAASSQPSHWENTYESPSVYKEPEKKVRIFSLMWALIVLCAGIFMISIPFLRVQYLPTLVIGVLGFLGIILICAAAVSAIRSGRARARR